MAQDIRVALTLDNKQFNSALKQSEKNVKGLSGTTANTTTSVKGLAGAFQAFIAIGAVREIVRLTDQFTSLNNRLKAVTSSEIQAATALRLVQQVASETRSDLSAVAGLFADITIASEELGLSQERVAGIAKVFSQSLKVSGADAGTAAGAIRQFGQALASGVLRGDEFNSINEANSKFMGELANAVGVTRGELRQMAEQGEITAAVMIEATEQMAGDVEKAFGKTVMTIGDAFTNLRNVIVGSVGEIGEVSGAPSLLAVAINDLANAIKALQPLINVLATIGTVLGTLAILGAKVFAVTKILGLFGNKLYAGTNILKATNKTWGQTFKIWAKAGKEAGFINKIVGFTGVALRGLHTQLKLAFNSKYGTKQIASGINSIKEGFSKAVVTGSKFKLVLSGIGKLALFAVRKLFAFTIVYDVFKLVVKAVAALVDWIGRLFKVDLGWLKAVNDGFDYMWKSIYKAGGMLWDFTKGLFGIKKEAKEVAKPLDEATLAFNAFNKELEDVRNTLSKGFLKNEQADKYATDWEKATKRVGLASNAIAVLEKGLLNAESFVGPVKSTSKMIENIERLRAELGASTSEFDQATAALANMEKGFTDSFKAIQDALADGLGVKDLDIQNIEFGFSDLNKAIEAEIRKAIEVAETETEKLTDLIANPDIPDSLKTNWITALSAIPNALEFTKSEIRRLMTEISIKDEAKKDLEEAQKVIEDNAKKLKDKIAGSTKALGDFQAQLANANTPADLENLRERLAELGRTGVLFGKDFTDAKDAYDKAIAGLTKTKGIKNAIEDIAKSMTPFQLAVDATNAVWGNMSSAIDDLVDKGKASFSDLARSIIKDLSKMILKQMLFNAIAGFANSDFGTKIGLNKLFPPKATGGPVAGNKPYMVGEQGPELFVPRGSGNIVPNNASGGGGGTVTNNYITNNINALDSKSVQQVFAENRQALLGTVEYARKETSYGV